MSSVDWLLASEEPGIVAQVILQTQRRRSQGPEAADASLVGRLPGLEPGTRQVSCLISSPAVHRMTRKLRRSSGAVGTGPVTKRYRRCRPAAGCRLLGWVKRMSEPVRVTLYNDAGCPWGYSANPAFRVLEWRYGAQLEWRLVLIGLTNVAQEYVDRGYTPLRSAEGYARRFRRFGMPLAPNPRARIVGTGRSCRAIVAVRLQAPGREWAAFRALQFGFFTTTLLLDEDESLATVLSDVEGIDVEAAIAAIDTPAVEDAYQRDRAEARSAAGSPTQLQLKHATTDGPVRYTAPSLVFERADRRLEAGGWQTIEAYDVVVANLIPDGERRGAPDDPLELLTAFPGGLTTQEVAQLLTRGNDAPDRVEAEASMLRLVADGTATRTPLGDDALWTRADTHESSALRA